MAVISLDFSSVASCPSVILTLGNPRAYDMERFVSAAADCFAVEHYGFPLHVHHFLQSSGQLLWVYAFKNTSKSVAVRYAIWQFQHFFEPCLLAEPRVLHVLKICAAAHYGHQAYKYDVN